jgi:hypothetical protein
VLEQMARPRPEFGSTFFSANCAISQACSCSITGPLCRWWAPKWTKKQIAKGRVREARAREKYYGKTPPDTGAAKAPRTSPPPATTKPDEE